MIFEPKFANLVEVYHHAMAQFGDRPLFGVKTRGRWEWMTYGEFGRRVDAVRSSLHELGVRKGDRVAVISDNRPEWAVAAYASYGLGAAFVPMFEAQIDKEWRYILDDCGARVLFVANDGIRDRVGAFRKELPALGHFVTMDTATNEKTDLSNATDHSFAGLVEYGRTHPLSDATAGVAIEGDDVAGFIYTSGTTGDPKGVLLSHANLASNVSAIHRVFPMAPEDRSLSFLPWAHSFGQTVELHALFSMGASLGIAEAVDKIIDNLSEVQPTLLFSVPRIFNRMYDVLHRQMAAEGGAKEQLFLAALANSEHRKELAAKKRSSGWADFKQTVFERLVFSKVRARFGGKLKYAFSGGAAISREVAEFVDSLGITVYEGYGLTETSPIATMNFPGSRKIGSVGKPIPGVTIRIDTSVTDDPKNGEVIVYGHNVMKGYHGLDEANAEVFVQDPELGRGLRTGDLGMVDGEGFLHITGRIKEQYKLVNGKYVVPTPLEEQIKLSPMVANVMIHGLNQKFNVAIIVPDFVVLGGWCRRNKIGGGPTDWVTDRKVIAMMERELDKQSVEFKQYEKVRKFVLVTKEFSTDNDMLTPTMKLKRRNVTKAHQAELDALYAD